MKKEIKGKINVFFTIVVLSMLILASCGTPQDSLEKEKETATGENEDVIATLEVKENTIDSVGCTLIVHNISQKEISFGEAYKLMEWLPQQEEWSELKCIGDWIGLSYTLNADEKKEMKVSFTEHYGELAEGRYKIIKTINHNFTCAVEFEVK